MNQQPHTQHPLVARYLDDLDALLQGIEPVERAEVVEGVREHIEASLDGTDRSDANVIAVLNEIGPATVVAEEAYTGRSSTRWPPAPQRRPPVTSRKWLPATVAGFEAVLLLVAMLMITSTGVVGPSSSTITTAGGRTITTTVVHLDLGKYILYAVTGLIPTFPFWLVMFVLVTATALWTAREKTALIALPFAAMITVTVLPQVGYALTGIHGLHVGAGVALVLIAGGGGCLLWVLVRRATRRSQALAN